MSVISRMAARIPIESARVGILMAIALALLWAIWLYRPDDRRAEAPNGETTIFRKAVVSRQPDPPSSGGVTSKSGAKIGDRRPEEPEVAALAKGDLLIPRPTNGPMQDGPQGGNRGALAHIKINGSPEFVAAMRQTIADFEARASASMLDNVKHVVSVNEISRDGGRVLAFVREGGCDVRFYPHGWQTSAPTRASVFAHEAWHCTLYSRRQYAESANHGPSFARIEEQAAYELYGSGRGGGSWASAQYSGKQWRRPCDNQ